jgi:tellurite resistance-related uncharacterized protein
MTRLPSGLIAYKRAPIFTERTVPAGLLKDHSTKEGTWGLIHVDEGELHYFITDSTRRRIVQILTPSERPGVVEPTIVHRVEPMEHVRFGVQFWRLDDGSGANERVHAGLSSFGGGQV